MPTLATDTMLEQWRRDGYFIVPGLFDADESAAMIDWAIDAARTPPEGILALPEGNVWAGARQPEHHVAKVFRIHTRAPFQDVALDSRMLDLVEPILGPDFDLFLSQFIFKWPEAYGQPWHQDSFYFPYDPDRQVGVWIAANRASIANGCLWVVPGSQVEPVHEHVPDDRPNATQAYTKIVDHDMSARIPVEMEPGDVLVFDSHLMHMSTDNQTDDLRAALVCHYSVAGTEIIHIFAEHVAGWMPARRA